MMKDVTAFSTPLRKPNPASRLGPNTFKNQELSVLSFVDETLNNEGIENDCAKQDFFGLPSRVRDLYAEQRGIIQLYDWQNECLNITMRSNGANLVYSLPTSGGKTLVAEILLLRELLIHRKDVLFILPFVSIVQEKVRSLTSMGLELGFWVEEYAGNRGRIPPVKRRGSHSVLIATIEKAHSIVNALIDSKNLPDLGLVIVDELHMIGEGGSRGACLEMILTKIRLVSPTTRIIGMSATLANISDLTRFLDAQLYVNNFRPVRLVEYVKLGDHIYELTEDRDSSQSSVESYEEQMADRLIHRRMVNFQYPKQMLLRDPDHLVGLVAETLLGCSMHQTSVQSGHSSAPPPSTKRFSCLVFCPTKVHCENTARMLAELLPPTACFPIPQTNDPENLGVMEKMSQKRAELLQSLCIDSLPDSNAVGKVDELRSCCPVLEATVPRGVAYHHGGLTQEERVTLEEGFADGTLSVLCCTSTLAAGVNLPARRVIIRKPYIGSSFITGSQYQQIVGRAGRAGLDSIGESVTILQPIDRLSFAQMLASIPRVNPNGSPSGATSAGLCCSSLLYENGKGMRQLLLSLIGLQIASTHNELLNAVRTTLFAIQARYAGCDRIEEVVNAELHTLISRDLVIAVSTETHGISSPARTVHGDVKKLKFQATKLGRAAVRGGLDTDQVGPLLSDLRVAARALNTSGPLHLLYLVAPPEVVDQIQVDWNVLYERISLLPPSEANIITLLGFPEGYVLWKAAGHPIRKKLDERPLRRLFVALALSELWQSGSSVPTWKVADRYQLSRGALQSLLSSAASLASCLAHALASEYASDEELWAFSHLLPQFATRLAYCVSSELLPLMELPGVKRSRARQLYNAGFCTLKDVACAEPCDLTTRLAPYLSRRKANDLIQTARMLVSERADALHMEATELLAGVHPRSTMSQLADDFQFQRSYLAGQSAVKQEPVNKSEISTPISTSVEAEEEDDDLFA